VRKVGEKDWRDVSGGHVDPTTAYVQHLPSGRTIALFFYDGPIARAVAFEGLLHSGERFVERLEELGARVVEAAIPEPPDDTWPLFYGEAAAAHRATYPARADEYGDNVRTKLEHAVTVEPEEIERARDSVRRWREYRPDVDLYVSPALGVEIPPVDCDELAIRISASAFLRPFNVLGWAALAIGDLQLVASRDETVLAAGLAWERAGGAPEPPPMA
jgi:Asp-tRNA(Asn)/Glu-tRNA(Gln) amidotransferase A subunit family amidase